MTHPYLCPSCRSNRTRFAIIDQVPIYVKVDPKSGETVQQYERNELEIFHLPYQGTTRRIQCGACGLIEDEETFIAVAKNHTKNNR